MTNVGFGAALFKAARYPQARMLCIHPSSDGTLLGKGDIVKLAGGTAAVGNGNHVPKVIRAATGDRVFGVVLGVELWNQSSPVNINQAPYCPASTAMYLQVIPCTNDDIYRMQEDSVGGSVAESNYTANANFIVANASTTTGLSGTMLDSSTAADTNTLDLRLVGIWSNPLNVVASNSILLCQFNKIQTMDQIVGV